MGDDPLLNWSFLWGKPGIFGSSSHRILIHPPFPSPATRSGSDSDPIRSIIEYQKPKLNRRTFNLGIIDRGAKGYWIEINCVGGESDYWDCGLNSIEFNWIGLDWIGLKGWELRKRFRKREGCSGVLDEDDEVWCCAYICRERERERKEGFGNGLMVAIREARVKRNETEREREREYCYDTIYRIENK